MSEFIGKRSRLAKEYIIWSLSKVVEWFEKSTALQECVKTISVKPLHKDQGSKLLSLWRTSGKSGSGNTFVTSYTQTQMERLRSIVAHN